MTTTVAGLIAPSPEDPLYSLPDTITQLRDQLIAALAPQTANVTLGSLYKTIVGNTPRVVKVGSLYTLVGSIQLAQQVTFAAGTTYQLGTIPTTVAPPVRIQLPVPIMNTIAFLSIFPNGTLSFIEQFSGTYQANQEFMHIPAAVWERAA